MNKKRTYIFIVFLLIAAILVTGGKMYMNKMAAQKEEKVEIEWMSVLALKNTFEDIQRVEFRGNSYNKITGYYSMNIRMTNLEGESVKFSFMFTINNPREIDGWVIKDKEGAQKLGKTKKVQVIYSNEKMEEI